MSSFKFLVNFPQHSHSPLCLTNFKEEKKTDWSPCNEWKETNAQKLPPPKRSKENWHLFFVDLYFKCSRSFLRFSQINVWFLTKNICCKQTFLPCLKNWYIFLWNFKNSRTWLRPQQYIRTNARSKILVITIEPEKEGAVVQRNKLASTHNRVTHI